ncbi:MAG: lipoyl synthase [Candidatus Fermentibacteraceae bacterium]
MSRRAGKPPWVKVPTLGSLEAGRVRRILRRYGLSTVCNDALCPNRGHCYQRGTATFLLLGRLCTRGCLYCAIEGSDSPPPPDPGEPGRVAGAAADLSLSYVVLTSVTRDDLPDGGAEHFARTVEAVRSRLPGCLVEVLVPDFRGSRASLSRIGRASPTVFNHNLETVERLFAEVRPGAPFRRSLEVLEAFGRLRPDIPLKSGLMLGLGESRKELMEALERLREAGVELLTMGQYLQPSERHWPVARYLHPDEFDDLRAAALGMGFRSVASGPLVRSSYHADLSFMEG